MNRIIKTLMLKKYLFKFAVRIMIFVACAGIYVVNKPLAYRVMTQPMWKEITPLHVLWAIFMVMMLRHIFHTDKVTMALKKADREQFCEKEGYSELELLKFVQDQNVKAWIVMLVWLFFNAFFGILYLFRVIDEADLLMLTVFYFLCDYICILIYCPFQSVIMKNRCCVNCRIFEWGHFMMFTPMLFIRNFFSWSLFFTSCVVLLKWEIVYAKHPERFWHGSNQKLQCQNCKDKICQVKKKLAHKAAS